MSTAELIHRVMCTNSLKELVPKRNRLEQREQVGRTNGVERNFCTLAMTNNFVHSPQSVAKAHKAQHLESKKKQCNVVSKILKLQDLQQDITQLV